MAARTGKHTHAFAIVSHTEDRANVLVMCGVCPLTETRHLHNERVKVAPRKYRQATMEEFKEQFVGMRHVCCRKKKT